jgi:hypothetical protein
VNDEQRMRLQIYDKERHMAMVIHQKIYELCVEANKEGKDLEVGPIHFCEDRPTIDGHFSKFKFDYVFVERGTPDTRHDWTRYDCRQALK